VRPVTLCEVKYLTEIRTGATLRAMTSPRPLSSRQPPEPPALHARAMDNLEFIRDTMERAGSFTAVSGWGMVAVGVSAAVAAVVAAQTTSREAWLAVWIIAAVISLGISGWAIARKARAAKMPLVSGPAKKFALSFAPPIIVGAVLTLVLYRAGFTAVLPGLWLMLYGTAVIAGGAFSVPVVPVMGLCFMLAGVIALLTPAPWSDITLGASFAVFHIAFGVPIARRHGG